MTLPLSVAIVCKNNERTIGRTLDSIRDIAAEVVAIDSGSTDATIELLDRAGARVIRSEWLGHVRTKQLALDACSEEWVLCLDSDESPDEALIGSINDAIGGSGGGGPSAYRFNRQTFYRGRPLRHAWQPEYRLRLVRKDGARWAGLDPHDYLEPIDAGAPVGTLAGNLRHDSFESFGEHLRTQWGHAKTMAESLHADGKRGSLVSLMISPPGAFLKQIVLKSAWRDGLPGWLAASSTAAGTLMKHAMLLEMGRDSERGRSANP